MTLDDAIRLVEIGLALAVMQRAYEHLSLGDTRVHFAEAVLAMSLLMFPATPEIVAALWGIGLWRLWMFKGPYNGGADKMVLLALTCLVAAHYLPNGDIALAYLAVQLVLSYVVSGWVKLKNPDWRSGRALAEVFALSAYPQSEHLRALGTNLALMRAGSWAVIGFELAFPLALLTAPALYAALALAAVFHAVNAVLFGLNRFLWAWVAVFPALTWFQGRLFGVGLG